jgi:hypothetical protein
MRGSFLPLELLSAVSRHRGAAYSPDLPNSFEDESQQELEQRSNYSKCAKRSEGIDEAVLRCL